jgi:beta-phosphoglucomutase-like phosphatase (HAD superfamily)
MLRKPVEAALFDMDGLLLDTEAIYVEAMREAARTLGHSELSLGFCHSTAGVPGPERNRMIEAHYGEGFAVSGFYERLNFRGTGAIFDEAGIAHRKMIWRGRRSDRQRRVNKN